LLLAGAHPNVTLVWPPTGIALAGLLFLGYRAWPGVTLGAFLVNATTNVSLITALGIATGNTLEAVVGAYLLRRFAGFRNSLERLADVFGLVVLAAGLSTTVSATIGVTSLRLGEGIPWSVYGPLWWQWWLGDAMGALIVAPALLTWLSPPRLNASIPGPKEAGACLGGLAVAGLLTFGGWFPPGIMNYTLGYTLFPFLIWAALRFGPRGAVMATLVGSGLAIWGTAREFGPFVRDTPTHSLILLQIFMAVFAVTGMVIAAVIAERRRIEEGLRESEARNRAILETALDSIVTMDHQGRILDFNPAAERTFGHRRAEVIGRPVADLISPAPRQRDRKGPAYQLAAGERYLTEGRIELAGLRADGSEFPMELAITRTPPNGPPVFTGYLRDITERRRTEDRLIASLNEKEVLLKEIHHRVKNNLQIISSLLNLQSAQIKDSRSLEAFRESQNRVRSLALIHEKLYQSRDLATLDFRDYVRTLATRLFLSYRVNPDSIRLQLNVGDVSLRVDTAVLCGMIINELISNSLKYAFPEGGAGVVAVSLETDADHTATLMVRDDGVGFPKDVDFRNTESLGLQLVVSLTQQLEGTIELDTSQGTAFKIVFPEARFSPHAARSAGNA
jgi:PAS domain S-box-containing protein